MRHIKRLSLSRLKRIINNYRPKGRRNQGDRLNRPLDVSERNGSTCGPNPCWLYDGDDGGSDDGDDFDDTF